MRALNPYVVATLGAVMALVGLVSRHPSARWWALRGDYASYVNEMGERVITLMAPAFGSFLLWTGIFGVTRLEGPLVIPLGLAAALSMCAGLYVCFSLPVPDRLLMEGSFIRASREQRKLRRARSRSRRT